MRYIGIDPGGKNNGVIMLEDDIVIFARNIREREHLFTFIERTLKELRDTEREDYVFIIESYFLDPTKLTSDSTIYAAHIIEIIGALKYIIPLTHIIFQKSAAKKMFDKDVAADEFYDVHIRDAYLHVLYFKELKNEKKDEIGAVDYKEIT